MKKNTNFPEIINERIIQVDQTIVDSLKKMDEINKKLLLVFDSDRFIGVLSIGDIQKAIINNLSMDTSIGRIMRKEFVLANITDKKEDVFRLMKNERIECMPLIDKSGDLVDVYFWENIFGGNSLRKPLLLKLPVVIMAGGRGARLNPLTNVLPKPLIPIGEKTIIEKIMDKFTDIGCERFYLSVNYKAEMIHYYFSTLKNNKYQIEYIQEKTPLGTAGSLHLLDGKLTTTFFVSNCDIIIEEDISEILDYHYTFKNEITIVAALKNYSIPYGILETSKGGRLKSITEKPIMTFKINTGFYILEPQLIREIPKNKPYHITSLIERLKNEKRRVGVFPVSEGSWKDIGDWNLYLKEFRQ